MQSILVTGGAGFIGSHTCKALAAQGFQPITFDNLSRGHDELVKWGPLEQGDILQSADLDRAFERYRPKSVIHFAASAYVGESVAQPLAYYRNNVAGLINVIDAMTRYDVDTIVFSSSCATYGIANSLPIAENAAQKPINPYGHSKLMCEQILLEVAAAQKLRVALLRYFNACGADPDGELTEWHDPETHLIPLAIDAASGLGASLQIFGTDYPTRDGTCERDFIHVSDLAWAHVAALHRLGNGTESLILNLGVGRAYSILEIVSAIERVTGHRVPVTYAPRRAGDPAMLVADASRAKRLLEFRPKYSELETIIRTTWQSRTGRALSGRVGGSPAMSS
jgi:UDP-arabinose 4-epimerase